MVQKARECESPVVTFGERAGDTFCGWMASPSAVRRAAASSLVKQDQIITVYEGLGYKRLTVERVGERCRPRPLDGEAPRIDAGIASAAQVLRNAVKAHGGRGGGVRLLQKILHPESSPFSHER